MHGQSRDEWRCRSCQATACDMLEQVACNNLLRAEDEGSVYPRDGQEDRYAGVQRWIEPTAADRNNCPGCGCDYFQLVESFSGSELDETSDLPKSLVRQCVICLEQKQ